MESTTGLAAYQRGCPFGPGRRGPMLELNCNGHEAAARNNHLLFKPLLFGDHQSKLNGKEIDARGGMMPNLQMWGIDFGARRSVGRSHLWMLGRW